MLPTKTKLALRSATPLKSGLDCSRNEYAWLVSDRVHF